MPACLAMPQPRARRVLSVAALRPPAIAVNPVGVPARLPSAFPSSPATLGEAGEYGAKRAAACPQARCRRLMSAPCPHGTETRSGVGRVARRARLAAKPFSRALPRLTLKAGHKAGLPTTPLAVRKAAAFAPLLLYLSN